MGQQSARAGFAMRVFRWAPFALCLLASAGARADETVDNASAAVVAAARADAAAGLSPERQFQIAVHAMRTGHDADALAELYGLTQREPNFRLARLLYAELLALRSGVPGALPINAGDSAELKALRDEYVVRVGADGPAPALGSLPGGILELSGGEPYVLLADLSRSRLYVLANKSGQLHVVDDFYATQARNGYGKRIEGDLMTPVGIYRATMFTPGSALPAFYGAGAFPLNYPNSWDRVRGRTGTGIWLHGVPADTYSRPPRASEGCLVLANDDLLALKQIIRIGQTPVIFSDRVDWVSPEQQAMRRAEIRGRIEGWREAWSRHNEAAYRNFYARNFRGDDHSSHPQFTDAKLIPAAATPPLDVKLSDFSLFVYPGQKDLLLAQFTQSYSVDNVATMARREQYWQREGGRWKIVHEDLN